MTDIDLKALNIYDFCGRDLDAEENGAWFALEDEDGVKHPEAKLKLRTLNNEIREKFSAHSARLEKDAKTVNGGKPTEKDKAIIAMKALIASGVVLDWQGFKIGDTELDFKYAERVLTDPTFDHVAAFIMTTVMKPRAFREAAKEAALKN